MSQLTTNIDDLLIGGRAATLYVWARGSAKNQDAGGITCGELRMYCSRILKVLSEEILVVWPGESDGLAAIDVGMGLILEIKCDRGVARLNSRVVAKTFQPISVLHVDRAGMWSRTQSRLNIRLEVAIADPETILVQQGQETPQKDNALVVLSDQTERMGPAGEWIEAIIRDLSAGGALLGTSTRLEPGAIVSISFSLGKGQNGITSLAKVVWVGEDEMARKYRFNAGCQFLSLRTGEQDRIAKFIFAKQAELRRWGLV